MDRRQSDERAAFEAWSEAAGYGDFRYKTTADEYVNTYTDAQWVAWKGARAALIAENARMREALERISRAKPDRLNHAVDVSIIERCANVASSALAEQKERQ